MHLAPMPKDSGKLKIFSYDLHCHCNQQINPSHISASTSTNKLHAGVSTNTKNFVAHGSALPEAIKFHKLHPKFLSHIMHPQ